MSQTILVVDDEPLIIDIISSELQDEGFQVETAESGEEAFEKISNKKIDLIVSDYKMPGISGVQLLHKIHKNLRKYPPFILVTAYGDTPLEEALNHGAQAVLHKPINYKKLIATIQEKLKPIGIERWNLGKTKSESAIPYKVNYDSCEGATGELLIGQGGVFLATDKSPPQKFEVLDIKIRFESEDLEVRFEGIVRWVQKEIEPYGFSVEISYMGIEDYQNFKNRLSSLSNDSYIPLGISWRSP